MPRDGAHTRQRLIEVGRTLFASTGVFATPLKAIVDGSGQRNTSALHYHFGSRQGLLDAIIEATNAGIEQRRSAMLDGFGADPSLGDLVHAWITPQADLLAVREGRQFLSIISQLNDMFDEWTAETMPPTALRTMTAIGDRLVQVTDPIVRRERLNRFLELTAEALGSRARLLDRVAKPALSHDAWVENLAQMCVGALSATAATPVRRSPPGRAGSR